MKNVIVTGGTGFIGQYMIKMLLERDCDVYVIVRKTSKLPEFFSTPGCHIIISDLASLTAELFPPKKYDVFLHLGWGGVNREEIDKKSIHLDNFNNSKKCIHIAESLKCELFADSGSRSEYGKDCAFCSEDNIGNPSDEYGYYKKLFYEYAVDFCNHNVCRYIHFRLFSVIGPGDHPWSLISTACRVFMQNEELKVGACEQLWNFMSINDVCEAMIDVMENHDLLSARDNKIVNIASADTRILRDYIKAVHELANSTSKITFDMTKTGFSSNPSIYKLSTIFSWKDKTTFEDEISRILNEERYRK